MASICLSCGCNQAYEYKGVSKFKLSVILWEGECSGKVYLVSILRSASPTIIFTDMGRILLNSLLFVVFAGECSFIHPGCEPHQPVYL